MYPNPHLKQKTFSIAMIDGQILCLTAISLLTFALQRRAPTNQRVEKKSAICGLSLKSTRTKFQVGSTSYTAVVESLLTSSISVWFGSLDNLSRKKLQRVVNRASEITAVAPPPSLQSLTSNTDNARSPRITSACTLLRLLVAALL